MIVKSTKKHYLDVAIVLLLMFGFGFLPAIPPITHFGMQVLGILLGCIYGWLRGSITWPSFLGLIILGFVSKAGVNATFATAWSNDTVIVIIMSYFFCVAISKSNLMDTICKLILKRNFARKSPWLLALALYIICAVSSALMGNVVTCLLLWSMFDNMIDIMKIDRKHPYIPFVAAGIAVVSYTSYMVVPWNVGILICNAIMTAVDPTFVFDFLKYSLANIVFTVLIIPTSLLIGKIICPKIENYVIPDEIIQGEINVDMKQIVAIACTTFVVVLLFLPSIAPQSSFLYVFATTLGTAGTLTIAAIVMMVVIVGDRSIADMDESLRSNSFNWSTVFLVMAALGIAGYLTTDATGIGAALLNLFQPIFAGKNIIIFLILICAVCSITTNCFNNAVMMSLLVPIGAMFAMNYGVSNQWLITIMAALLIHGLVLPSGSMLGSLLHAQNKLTTSGQAMKYAAIHEVFVCLIVIVVSLVVCTFGLA